MVVIVVIVVIVVSRTATHCTIRLICFPQQVRQTRAALTTSTLAATTGLCAELEIRQGHLRYRCSSAHTRPLNTHEHSYTGWLHEPLQHEIVVIVAVVVIVVSGAATHCTIRRI